MKKNKLLLVFSFGIFFMLQLTQSSCTSDTLPENTPNPVCDSLQITFDNQVQPIINASCAFTGCHVAGFAWGDYTTYDGISSFLNENQFEREVIVTMDMPIGGTLTDDELEIMECWIQNNYAEN